MNGYLPLAVAKVHRKREGVEGELELCKVERVRKKEELDNNMAQKYNCKSHFLLFSVPSEPCSCWMLDTYHILW